MRRYATLPRGRSHYMRRALVVAAGDCTRPIEVRNKTLADFSRQAAFKGIQTERLLAMGRAIRSFASRAPKLAVSCDVAEKSAQAGLRVSCIHGSREEALQSADDIRELLTLAKAEFAGFDHPDHSVGLHRLQDGCHEVVLAVEVVVEAAAADAGAFEDLTGADAVVAVLDDELARRLHDPVAGRVRALGEVVLRVRASHRRSW